MPWKMFKDEATGAETIETLDGNPILIRADGKGEIAMDGDQITAKVTALNRENEQRRLDLEALKTKFAAYEPIEDPEAAIKALETVRNIGDKKLIDADQAQKVRDDAVRPKDAEIATLKDQLKAKDVELSAQAVGFAFAVSPLMKGDSPKFAQPVELMQSYFGGNFKTENGKVVGYLNGAKITSNRNLSEDASFDEALEIMVNASQIKDSIIRSPAATGGGSSSANATTGTQQPDDSSQPLEARLEREFARGQASRAA